MCVYIFIYICVPFLLAAVIFVVGKWKAGNQIAPKYFKCTTDCITSTFSKLARFYFENWIECGDSSLQALHDAFSLPCS